jgi:hypothetical protein
MRILVFIFLTIGAKIFEIQDLLRSILSVFFRADRGTDFVERMEIIFW